MHYYQFNIGDYRKDTTHLVPIEHYIYRTLIDTYYLDESPITNDLEKLIRRLSLDPIYLPNITNVLNDFFVESKDGWIHKRINVDIHGYKENIVDRNRRNGKLGGRPKKTQWDTSGNPDVTQKNPNQELLTNNQEPVKKICQKPNGLLTNSTDVINLWNEFASTNNLPQKRAAPDNLKNQINTISKKQKWKLDDWDTFLNILSNSDFLMGKSSDWKMNMDWLAKPANFSKAISGNYTT